MSETQFQIPNEEALTVTLSAAQWQLALSMMSVGASVIGEVQRQCMQSAQAAQQAQRMPRRGNGLDEHPSEVTPFPGE
jgi:hypothetical protein